MATLDFDLTTIRDGDGSIRIVVRGELDLGSSERLEAALLQAGESSLLVDLRGLTFMDSTGVRTLLQATEDAGREGRELRFLVPTDGDARMTLIETGIVALLPLVDDAGAGR
jgi:anti-anti-sigma factor